MDCNPTIFYIKVQYYFIFFRHTQPYSAANSAILAVKRITLCHFYLSENVNIFLLKSCRDRFLPIFAAYVKDEMAIYLL